jgi:hypothetical protein
VKNDHNTWIRQRLACESDDLLRPSASDQVAITRLSLEYAARRGLEFSTAALENLEETGVEWELDLQALQRGTFTVAELLERCLDGADEDRVQGWRDYVDVLEAALDQSRDGGYATENPGDGGPEGRHYGN